MNRPRPHVNQIHPLPGDFPQALRDLDARLARQARTPVPSGLADRIFQASAGMLPNATSGRPRLRLVGTETPVRKPLHQTAWARLAMAACVAIICSVGLWFVQHPSSPIPQHFASAQPHQVDHAGAFMWAMEDAQVVGSPVDYHASLEYLLETSTLTTEELTSELAMLVSRF